MRNPVRNGGRSYRRAWLAAAALFLIALPVSVWWAGPEPPRELVMATGEAEGVYAAIGDECQKRLAKLGLTLHLRPTAGSVENLDLLLAGAADVALIQAGVYTDECDPEGAVRGLLAVQWEPVWVFYRGPAGQGVPDLSAAFFRPRRRPRIAVGPEKSGRGAIAQALLRANGIDRQDAEFVPLSMTATGAALKAGAVDVGIFVSSARNPVVQDLLRQESDPAVPEGERVRLLSFHRHQAYARHFPFLSAVVLGEGVLDLEKNVPPREVKLFATPTVLACRADLHPRAVERVLLAARHLPGQPDLVTTPGGFPPLETLGLPAHETAEVYARTPVAPVSGVLPYWGVWALFKLQVLLLPLLLFSLPFLRVLPAVYAFRVNWLLRRHYVTLRAIEDAVERALTPDEVREQVSILDGLRKAMERLSRKIPPHLQIHVYQWRLHVAHVRAEAAERLRELEQGAAAPEAGANGHAGSGNAVAEATPEGNNALQPASAGGPDGPPPP